MASTKSGQNTSFASLKQISAGVLNIGYAEDGPASGPTVIPLQGWPYDIYNFVEPPVAHAEGELNDLRAILGNDIAIDAYRKN